MPSVIGLRADVLANGHLGQTLDNYLMQVNGNTNWSIQDNLRWLCDRIAEADRFIIASDPGDLFDRTTAAGAAAAPAAAAAAVPAAAAAAAPAAAPAARNFTFGIEMMVLIFAGYSLHARHDGAWELRPRAVEDRVRAIGYVQDHLIRDINLLVSVSNFWQHNEDLLGRVKEDLGRMWAARFEEPDF